MNPYSHVNCKHVGSDWISGVCPACAWDEGFKAGAGGVVQTYLDLSDGHECPSCGSRYAHSQYCQAVARIDIEDSNDGPPLEIGRGVGVTWEMKDGEVIRG